MIGRQPNVQIIYNFKILIFIKNEITFNDLKK